MTTEVTQETNLTEEQVAEQEERDFLAAASDEPVPEPTPDLPAEQEGDDPLVANADESDIDLSSLPPSVIEKLEAQMMEKLAPQIEQKLSGRLRNIEGHIGGLKHNLTQLSAAKAAAEDQGAEAPSGSQVREAMQSGEKLARLKEDFPEFADALEETVAGINGRMPQLDMNELNQRFQTTEEVIARQANIARQMARLDTAYPDWEDTVNTDSFVNWINNQPQDIQALMSSEKASDAIKVLDSFASTTGEPDAEIASTPDLTAQSRQKSRLENAVTPTAGGQLTKRQRKTEHDEFLEAFNS